MVATRRGVRACSPTKSNSDESTDVSATPSSCRRTGRRTANREQTASQLPMTPVGAGGEEGVPSTPLQDQSSTVKRRTRASRLQSHRLDSTHEADVSDSESCCSAASDVDHPMLRRGRRKTPGRSSNPCVDLSDVDSCSSVTSASRMGPLARRGTKRAAGSGQSDSIPVESGEEGKEEGKDSCSSAASDTQRVTRSLRRSTITRSLASRRAEDAGDVSEVDSCASSISAAPSTSRRPARGRTGRSAQPIPMHLEEASDLPRSPTPSRRTRTPVADPGAWDSEGFESGPSVTPRRSTRKRTAPRYACSGTTDSDESLNVSPSVSTRRGRGIPCSKAVSVTRLSVVVERTIVSVTEESRGGLEEGAHMVEMSTEKPCHLGKVSVSRGEEEESVLEDSKLDATIGPEDVTLTLEEEEEEVIDLIDQDETDDPQGFCQAEESQRGSVIVSGEAHVEESEAASEPLPSQADTQAGCGPAVAAADQQRGQSHSASSTEEDVGAMTRETEAGPEPELRHGDTGGVTVCYVPVTAGEEGREEEAMDVAASSRAHSPELNADACHLVLSEEEGELEKVEGKAQQGEVVVVEDEEEEKKAEEEKQKEVVVLEEEEDRVEEKKQEEVVVVVLDQEEEEEDDVVVLEEQQQKDVVVERKEAQVAVLKEQEKVAEEENQEEVNVVIEKKVDSVLVVMEEEEDVVVLEEQQQEDVVVERKEAQVAVLKEQEEVAEEENQEEVNVLIEKKVDSVLVVMEEEEDVVVLEEQQQEDVVVERKEAQVAVLKEQEEVAEEENQEEVNVVIEKKVDSVLVVMEGEEEEMEVSVSAPETVEAGSEAAILPPQAFLPESIQVNSGQKLKVVVSEVTQQPYDSMIIQKAKVVSLLDSSEDEEEEEDEEVSGHEEEEEDNEDLAGPSQSEPVSDGLFVIDTRPGQRDGRFYQETPEEAETAAEDEEEFVDEDGDDEEDDDDRALFTIKSQNSMALSSRIDTGLRARQLGGLYVCFDGGKPKNASNNDPQKKKQKSDDQVMKKSVIGPEFEKQDAVPPYSESKQASKLKRKAEKEKTTGDGWFNMRAPEMTTELKGDLKALKMRAAMDPKRFYKKNDRDGFPKYFQVGTVVDSPVDFYHSRIPKKDRKRTMVEELLADAEFRHTNKKKYQQIMTEKAAVGAGRKRNRFLKNKKK